jgi:PAS domain S-box-containing protein
MEAVLKILMVEDLTSDAELIKHLIRKNELRLIDQVVENKEDYIIAIKDFKPDIILSDYSLPSFDGMQALMIREELAPWIPFILVTGSINEETAVEVMKAGADDYIIKDHIVRLPTAIKQAIEKKENLRLKKIAEAKVKLLAHSLESITECVSITDTNDQIIYVNDSFIRTYGYVEDELIGKNIDIVRLPEMEHIQVRNILAKTKEGGWRGEIMNKKKDGTIFPILLSSSVIKDENGKMIALIGVASDITEMIKNREELLEAKAKSEETNRLRSALLNNLSHEIRTPMNAIMGFAGLMSEANDDEKNAFASIILNSSGQLLSLIDEVILLSRLQSEKMTINFTGFSPAESVKDIFSIYSHQGLKQGIDLKMNIPEQYKNLVILSDTYKVRQILTNFVSNAIKYTNQGTIEIGFDLCNGQVEFYVKDTGIGIPENEQKRIFETFYRSEQAITSAIGGTGLGLSISKELVGLLGGTIGLSSEPNKGSRFYFTIPQRNFKKETDSVIIQVEKSKEIKGFVILIVDDEAVNIHYMNALLKNKVKRVDHAYNGKEAVEMALKHHYNLVLMDIKMPVMGGIEATKILKAKYPGLRIIAQTAFTLPEDAANVLEAGCDDILSKPVRKEDLLAMVQKYGNS